MFRSYLVGAGLSIFLASSVYAAECWPISDPVPNAGLEDMKQSLVDGDYESALSGSELSQKQKNQFRNVLVINFPDGMTNCVTLKRVRPSDHWISEIIMIEDAGVIGYLTISGQMTGDAFRVINIQLKSEFGDIRELLY